MALSHSLLILLMTALCHSAALTIVSDESDVEDDDWDPKLDIEVGNVEVTTNGTLNMPGSASSTNGSSSWLPASSIRSQQNVNLVQTQNEGLPKINGNVEVSPIDVAAGRNPIHEQHITRWVDANPTICPPSLDEHEWREHPVIPGVFQYRYETILHTHMETHSHRSRHVRPAYTRTNET